MKVRYMGHSSFEIETEKLKILTDPYYYSFSPGKKREVSPVKPEQIYDYILISHEHFDHCDTQLIDEIFSEKTKIITTPEAATKIGHPCHTLNTGMEFVDADDNGNERFRVQALKADHPQSENPISFYFFIPEAIYFAGDTHAYLTMGDIDPPFLAFLPIGGEFTSDSEGASEIAALIRPSHIIPMHYDTWDIIKADVDNFTTQVRNKTMAVKVHPLVPGQTVELTSTALPRV